MSNKHLNGYIDEDDRDYDSDAAHVHYPTCRFCGKQTIPVAPYESDEIADEAATMKCDCYDAQMYRQDKQKKELRDKNIAKLRQNINSISDYCDAHNIKLTPELCEIVTAAGIAVIDGIVLSSQFKFARLRLSLSAGSKSAVVIKATYSDGTQFEV